MEEPGKLKGAKYVSSLRPPSPTPCPTNSTQASPELRAGVGRRLLGVLPKLALQDPHQAFEAILWDTAWEERTQYGNAELKASGQGPVLSRDWSSGNWKVILQRVPMGPHAQTKLLGSVSYLGLPLKPD